MVRLQREFEWDERKAEIDRRKHSVSFDLAAEVLSDIDGDRFHLDEDDDEHDEGEDRFITTGSHPEDRSLIFVICWTDRSTDDEQVTRIISARLATKREAKSYAEELGG
jgi:uncharacterized DUF497 family protein